jgi:hypothetical protein
VFQADPSKVRISAPDSQLPCRGAITSHIHSPTFTNRLLYWRRFMARPLGFFGLSCFATFGVWPRTLPARANEPWTLPAGDQGETVSTNARFEANTSLKVVEESIPHPSTGLEKRADHHTRGQQSKNAAAIPCIAPLTHGCESAKSCPIRKPSKGERGPEGCEGCCRNLRGGDPQVAGKEPTKPKAHSRAHTTEPCRNLLLTVLQRS